jgi:hypothetical protein
MHPALKSQPDNNLFPFDAARHVRTALAQRIPAGVQDIDSVVAVHLPIDADLLPHSRVVVVDAGSDVTGADSLVAQLLPRALDAAHDEGGVGGDDNESAGEKEFGCLVRSKLLLGVMAVSAGDRWELCSGDDAGRELRLRDGDFFRPRQSCGAGRVDMRCAVLDCERARDGRGDESGLVPIGVVAWAGSGITRIDTLKAFDGRRRGGDGQLLVSQMLAEVLAKVGILGKFGA